MSTYEKMPRINIVFLFDVKRLQNSHYIFIVGCVFNTRIDTRQKTVDYDTLPIHYIFIVGCVFNTRIDTRRKTVDYDTLPIHFWVAVSAQFP